MITRRTLLAGSAPALVATPAVALGFAPEPISDPRERARRAWAEFSAAMGELSAPGDGWMLQGAGARRAAHGRPAEAWIYAVRLTYEWQADPRCSRGGILTEDVEPINLWRSPGARS